MARVRDGSAKRIVLVLSPKKEISPREGPEQIPNENDLIPASITADALSDNHPSVKTEIEKETAPRPRDELS